MQQRYTASVHTQRGVAPATVPVYADNADEAKHILEAQYGRGNVTNVQWHPDR